MLTQTSDSPVPHTLLKWMKQHLMTMVLVKYECARPKSRQRACHLGRATKAYLPAPLPTLPLISLYAAHGAHSAVMHLRALLNQSKLPSAVAGDVYGQRPRRAGLDSKAVGGNRSAKSEFQLCGLRQFLFLASLRVFTKPSHSLCSLLVAGTLPFVYSIISVAVNVESSPSLVLLHFMGCVLPFRSFLGRFRRLRRGNLWNVAPSP